MSLLDPLFSCAGEWRGENTLEDPMTGKPETSPSTLLITPVLHKRFVRVDYTWSHQGKAQEGMLLMGHDRQAGKITGHWTDTWHQGTVMTCIGPEPKAGGAFAVSGSYAAPPGPEWGWRIEVAAEGAGRLRLRMFNVDPRGRDAPAVSAVYERAAPAIGRGAANAAPTHVRHGMGAARPYVYCALATWTLVREAFGAVEVERHVFGPQAMHVEARLGDSMLVLEASDPPDPRGFPGSVYVYVPDVDAAHRRAVELGAQSVAAPQDKPYQERQAAVRDSFGNVWWISTYHA
jgi:PhnB protein